MSELSAALTTGSHGFGRLAVVIGRDGQAEGLIVVSDDHKAPWEETVIQLLKYGVEVTGSGESRRN